MHTSRNSYTWELGQCFASHKFSTAKIYTEKCCVSNGDHTLQCIDEQNTGWVNSRITIGHHTFCDDVVGYTKFILINIEGT